MYIINNIDATVIAQRPKLRPYMEEMEENIAKALRIERDRINLKATTEEGLGFTGSMEGISSQAICSLSQALDFVSDDRIAGRNCGGCAGCSAHKA